MNGKLEKSTPALLAFTPENGAIIDIAIDRDEHISSEELDDIMFNDSNPPEVLEFTGIYDIDARKTSRRRFILQKCTVLNVSDSWGNMGSASSIKYTCRYIHETNIIWTDGELPSYDYIRFSFKETEGWISNLTDMSRDYEKSDNSRRHLSHSVSIKKEENAYIEGLGKIKVMPNIETSGAYLKESNVKISHYFVYELDRPVKAKEIVKLTGIISDLISLGYGHPVNIESINMHMTNIDKSHGVLYFSPYDHPLRIASYTDKLPITRMRNAIFRYEDIGGIQGVKNWALRMMLSDRCHWEELVMVNLMLKGLHRSAFVTEYNFMAIITATVMLKPTRENLEDRILYLIKAIRNNGVSVPNILNKEWSIEVSDIRHKLIAHPESGQGRQYPSQFAYASQQILFRIWLSFVIKDYLGLRENETSTILDRLWSNPHTLDYIKIVDNYMKNLEKQSLVKQSSNFVDTKIKNKFTQAVLPPTLEELPKRILALKDKGKHSTLYEYQCPNCNSIWNAYKYDTRGYHVELSGYLNSAINQPYSLDFHSSLDKAQYAVRESVSSHFCVPIKK